MDIILNVLNKLNKYPNNMNIIMNKMNEYPNIMNIIMKKNDL